MESFGHILRKISEFCGILGALLVFLLVIWGVIGVITRYFFNWPLPGHYEGSTLLLVWITYLGIAITQFEEGHIRMSLLADRAKKRMREMLKLVGLVIGLTVSSAFLWRTGITALNSLVIGEFAMGTHHFPEWPGRLAIPIGFLLLCFTFVFQIWKHLVRKETGKKIGNI